MVNKKKTRIDSFETPPIKALKENRTQDTVSNLFVWFTISSFHIHFHELQVQMKIYPHLVKENPNCFDMH